MSIHVLSRLVNPSAAPTVVGSHWINTVSNRQWLAKGTASVADWVEITADTGITQLTGDVTAGPGSGSQAATLDKTALTGKSAVTPASGDSILLSDVSDSGNLKKTTVSDLLALSPPSPPAGSNTQIQFNDSGALGGDADFTWNKTTNVQTVAGVIELAQPSTNAIVIGNTGGNAKGIQAVNIQPGRATADKVASQQWAVAIGYETKSTGYGSIAIGGSNGSSALGDGAIALAGTASASNALAIGAFTSAAGNSSVAIGGSANASAFSSFSVGPYSAASAENAFALGYIAEARGVDSTAIAARAYAGGLKSTSIGFGTRTLEPRSTGLGVNPDFNVDPQLVLKLTESNFRTTVNIASDFGSEKIYYGPFLSFGTPVNFASSMGYNSGYTLLQEANDFDFYIYGYKTYPGGNVYTANYLSSGTISSGGFKPAYDIYAYENGSAGGDPGYQTTDDLDYAVYAYGGGSFQAVPSTVSNVAITTNGNQVQIGWNIANTANVSGYVILRTLNGVTTAQDIPSAFTFSYLDTNSGSAWAGSTTVTPSLGGQFRIEMTWDALAGMDGYRVIIYDTQNSYNYNYYIDVATNALNYDGTASSPVAGGSTTPADSSTLDMSTWTVGAAWTVDPPTQTIIKTGSGTTTVEQSSANMVTPLVAGEWYELSGTLTGNTNLNMTIGGATPATAGPGFFKRIFQATSTADLVLTPTNSSVGGVITAVSLKKITDGKLNAFGNANFEGTVKIGAGSTPLTNVLGATATLDFPSTSSYEDLTVTVTGAAVGDVVSVGVPNDCIFSHTCYFGWVSAADTVTVRFLVVAAGPHDPPSSTFKVLVTKF